MRSVPFEELSFPQFHALLHSRFRVITSSNPVELDLIEASARANAQPASGSSPDNFSLIFAGPLTSFLPQKTYRFEHDHFGAFDLFIVPVGKDARNFHYEAVFNQARPQTP